MSLNVLGGGLEATFELNTDSIEKGIEQVVNDGIKNIGKLEKAFSDALNGKTLEGFKSTVAEAVGELEKITPLLEKGFEGLDTSKLESDLAGTTDQFEQLQKITGFIEENLSQLNLNPEEIEQLRTSIGNISETFKGLSENSGSITSQIRELKNILNTESPDSPLFKAALEQAAELQEKMKNVQQELKLAGNNAPGLQATSQAVRGLVGGFTALNGVMALYSGESEDVEKTIKSLVASMAVLQGIQEVSEVLDKNSALNIFLTAQYRKLAAVSTTEQAIATELLTGATASQAVATGSAAVAQTGLNTAMKLNPAGLLLAGLTAVVAAIQFFSKETKDAEGDLKRFNLQIEQIGQTADDLIQRIRFVTDLNEQAARNRGDVESKVTEATIQGYKDEVKAYQSAIDEKRRKAKDFFTTYINLDDRSLAQANLDIINRDLLDPDLSKKQQASLQAQKTYVEGIIGLYDNLSQAEQNIQKAQNELTAQQFQEALRSAKGFAEARLLLVKKNSKEQLDAEISAINARVAAEINAGNLTAGERQRIVAQQEADIKEAQERFRILQLNNRRELVEAELAKAAEGSLKEFELKVDLIEKTAAVELAATDKTEQQKTNIRAKAAKEIADLTREFNLQVAESDIETTLSGIRARVAVVKEGTAEELNLRKEVIDEQARLDVLRASDQIKNEAELQAKISEIFATALGARKKLEEDYVRNFLRKQFEDIDRATDRANDPLQKVINNPRSSGTEKYAAQLRQLQNELDALSRKQLEVANQIVYSKGNIEELTKQYDDLGRAISKVKDQQDNLTDEKFAREVRKLVSDITAISGAMSELAGSLAESNPELADTLQTLSDIGNIAGSVGSAIASFMTGDIAGGITSTIKAVAGIFNIGKAAKESRKQAQADIEAFNAKILAGEIETTQQYRERQREQEKLNKIRLQGLLDEKRLLQEQKVLVQQQYDVILAQLQAQSFVADTITKKYGGVLGIGRKTKAVEVYASLGGKTFDEIEKLFNEGRLTGKALELFELLQRVKQEGADIDTLLTENAQTFKEAITGTTTDSITSSIIDGFAQGKRSVFDFADTFQQSMRQALLSSLQLKYLDGPLKDFFNEFAGLVESDGQLTSGEVSSLQTLYNNIIANAATQFEQLQQIAGINLSTQSGVGNTLSGAIRGITEQQAELLAGQFGGLRITALEQLNIARQHLSTANQIQSNTAATVSRMSALLQKFDNYETGQRRIHVQI